jgi:transketolase
MMSLAAGIASTGKRVFVYSIGNFPTLRCLEQIRNDVCLMNNPVAIVAVGAGYAYGPQGYTHHALEDIAVMRALPNMEVLSPCDSTETEFLTRILATSLFPAYLRLGRDGEPELNKSVSTLKFGKIVELLDGDSGTILFSGSVGSLALEAKDILHEKGISVSVASMPFVSSIDIEFLRHAQSRGPLVVVEEHSFRGGVGSAILEKLSEAKLSLKVGIVAAKQSSLSQIGSQEFLRSSNSITTSQIVQEFISLLEF